jgi:hypothetical protein
MSTKYPGGFITKSPVAPTSTAASGIWTLDQQQQAQKAGTWPSPPLFIEDLFSTYLYTGNGSTQTITNGIDLSGQGGMVWLKDRDYTWSNEIFDTVRGAPYGLYTNSASAQVSEGDFGNFLTNGFSLDGPGINNGVNSNGDKFASWTFREAPKFFDIVTATNVGGTNARISHNLGSVPGFVIVKAINYAGESWRCYHRSLGRNNAMQLNLTDATFTLSNYWGTSDPTATDFGINWTLFSGTDYIFYFFAHDAGGFPASGSGSTNGISCGSYIGNGSATGPVIDLGYEPQFVMIKAAENVRTSPTSYNNWAMIDVMRGMPNPSTGTGYALGANLSTAENGGFLAASSTVVPTATGFQIGANESMYNFNGCTYIYIAIRRGPMKTPTVGTSVYNGIARTGNGTATTVSNSGFTPDMVMSAPRTAGPSYGLAFPFDRLRGALKLLETRSTGAEQTGTGTLTGFDTMNGYIVGTDAAFYGAINTNSVTYINWNFKRAPGFFDEVCYTTPGSTFQVVTHNLGVTPELIIVKQRNNTNDWGVQYVPFGSNSAFYLNTADAVGAGGWSYFFTSVTASSITATTSVSGYTAGTYVAYLFATCAGVSKVGSYTGTGALLTVNCGFTSGARFVLIKRSDSTGDWYTYDSARGITSGNDPYLLLNSSAAEVTGTNYVDTDTTGFQVTAAAPAGLNANGGTYIFLAIA